MFEIEIECYKSYENLMENFKNSDNWGFHEAY